ncbi:MAG: DNA mismatch repair endonuclease MutL [Deltaproteobacteria bacterium]|nr:DNA mismatch repair endonuclease MutL [Deltaproteobacteria bacterium]
MSRINVLDTLLASKIAAGEVIERPASVVKELMENSLDAGATSISVYITEGGKRLIRVVDNGEGIAREDAPLVFLRHATSKVSREEDLEAIRTMGFRGEALASIASIAKVVLKTRRPGDIAGTSVEITGGGEPQISEEGCPEGTSIEVREIFHNMPARLKFLRSPEAEFGRILEIFKRIALVNPGKRFKLIHGSSRPLETAPGDLKERVLDLFGSDYSKKIIKIETPFLSGLIGNHELAFQTTKSLFIYVNGRPIRDKGVNKAIMDGYGPVLDGRFPFALLDIKIPHEDVDINIHPAKSEVRFKNQKFIYDTVKLGIKGALGSGLLSKTRLNPDYGSYNAGAIPGRFAEESAAPYGISERSFDFSPAETGDVKNPEFLSLEVIGQLWGEFLVAEGSERDGELYLIDQHGAAERGAFEALKEKYYGSDIKRQMLLLPERIETSPDERDAIMASNDYLLKLGFELFPFGQSPKEGGETFLLKSVPDLLASRNCSSLIKDLAEELSSLGGSSRIEDKIDSVLMRIACHSVIRGPRTLTKEQGKALLKYLSAIDFAGHCPHGRPVVKKISRKEIETMFKR